MEGSGDGLSLRIPLSPEILAVTEENKGNLSQNIRLWAEIWIRDIMNMTNETYPHHHHPTTSLDFSVSMKLDLTF